jgi:hypothetical protein
MERGSMSSTTTGLVLIVHELDVETDGLSSFLVNVDRLREIEGLEDDSNYGGAVLKAWNSLSKTETIAYRQKMSYNRTIWPCLIQMPKNKKVGVHGCVVLYLGEDTQSESK